MECARNHERVAEFRCVRCGKLWCGDCVSTLNEHSKVKTCPECSDMAVPLPLGATGERTLLEDVAAALRAPFQMPAASIMVIGGVLSCISLAFYWLHPYAAVLCGVIVLGYFNAYAASIANNTVLDLKRIDWFGESDRYYTPIR